MALEVFRCGELESQVHLPRNSIGRPGTNRNRAHRKQAFLEYLDADNTSLGSKHVETTLVVQEYCLRL